MNIGVGKAAVYGLCGGTIAGATVAKPKTQKGEHAANKFSTAVSLGALATTPYLVKQAVKANPRTYVKVANKAGHAIEKVIKYVKEPLGKAITNFGKYIRKAISEIKNEKLKNKLFDKFEKFGMKYEPKVSKKVEEFLKSSTTKKGAIGLAAAGVALLAYGGFKIITNFYKKEGAIDQKYKDMEVMDKILL